MARLIDAKELERQIKEAFEDSNPVLMGQMLRWIRKQPKVDAVEVVHGHWVCLEPEIGLYVCSECDHRILRAKCNYCPNCGAKMDGDGNG